MAVITWSLQQAVLGIMPSKRHDGSKFLNTDSWRKKVAGNGCPKGLLVEFRADWVFLKQLMRFPQFNENAGCCWMCKVTPQTWRQVGQEAQWRSEKLTHWDLLRRMLDQGLSLSPLWGAPCFRSECIQADWLHTADKGVAATFLGSYLKYISTKFPGTTIAPRMQGLWEDVQKYYAENDVASKLDNLKWCMLGNPGKTPCLNSKAAEARFLVPYAHQSAQRLLGDSPVEATIKSMAYELYSCYECLSRAKYDQSILAQSCRRYCVLAVAMEARSETLLWGLKPKLHLFQELGENAQTNPSLSWTYRDEDFGGTLSALATRRGGANTPTALA